MRTELLNYELPEELIAQRPAEPRDRSRLLVMERKSGTVTDRQFTDIKDYLRYGDCLVLNDTKVLAARFLARRAWGGRLEGLFLEETEPGRWLVMLKNAQRVKSGETIWLCDRGRQDAIAAVAQQRLEDGRWLLGIDPAEGGESLLERIGFAPLPPYIKRAGDAGLDDMDLRRYQTVYARQAGAVAAPTAGLHFTPELLEEIKRAGVKPAYVTLHVGAGTFKPVKTKELDEHKMHEEGFSLSGENAGIINNTIKAGGRIIAVGTTSVRTLETIANGRQVKAAYGRTRLFIQPGYEFRIVDVMVTNFHLPKSTLLALVAAFAGLENTLAAYRHAVEQRYRFYSYGDAMLII